MKGMAYEGIADSEGIICVRGRILSWSVYKDHCMNFDISISTRIFCPVTGNTRTTLACHARRVHAPSNRSNRLR